jgi:hypothetical protein
MIVSTAIDDASSIAGLIAELSPSGREAKLTPNHLAEHLAMGSPALLDWAITTPAEFLPRYTEQLFSNLAVRSPQEAADWVNGVEATTEAKDIFFARFAAIRSSASEEEGLRWADQITSLQRRELEKRRIRRMYQTARENQ